MKIFVLFGYWLVHTGHKNIDNNEPLRKQFTLLQAPCNDLHEA